MKLVKSLMAVALTAAAISTASAAGYNNNTVVTVTGSTAFRSAANNYLYSKFGSYLFATDQSTTNAAGAGNLYFTNVPGTLFGATNPVDIAVYWSGSEAGVQSAASGTNTNSIGLIFFDYTKIINNTANTNTNSSGVYLSVAGVSFTGSLNSASTNANTVYTKGQISFSDTLQNTSAFHGTYNGVTYHSLTQSKIGVVPFSFYTEVGNTNTNLTTTVAYELWNQGYVPANLLTGILSDSNCILWCDGRFPDSGTRLNALMTMHAGALASVIQFKPMVNTNNNTISNLNLWAAGTINGVPVTTGNNGESSGGTLAKYLTNAMGTNALTVTDTTETPAQVFTVGATNHLYAYVSVGDGATVTGYTSGTGPIPCTYNGVVGRCGQYAAYTNTAEPGYANIINGSYPFWCYEQIGYDGNSLPAAGGVKGTPAVNLATNMIATIKTWNSTNNYAYLAPNIALTEMKVNRTSDGGNINNN